MDPNQNTIFFSFNEGTSDETVAARVSEIKGIKGVFNAYALKKDSSSPRIRLMHVAKLDGTADAEQVLASIQKVKDVKYAEFPAPRYPAS